MCGRITNTEVFDYLSSGTGCPQEELRERTRKGIEGFVWNTHVWAFSQEVRNVAKTAIVTINCDLFHHHIVPFFQLDSHFDAILSFDEYDTASKAALCMIAPADYLAGMKPV